MNFEGYLSDLRRARFYHDQIAHVERCPARAPEFGILERPLTPMLQERLAVLGAGRLYSHQAKAVNASRRGEHVTVVTATASGKTLCYNLPVLDAILTDPKARAIYLFPTKALAQDQLGKLDDLGMFPTVRYATYDGDTSQPDRTSVRRHAQIVLTNPDMLHVGILPQHASWARFFANLRYVVVDELHTYRGAFGAHVAQVLRRLRRLCAHYGASPQFICCSATVANPEQLTHRLTGVDGAVIVDENGAPTGPRTFVFWNPPLIDAQLGVRRSPHIEATLLFADLVQQRIRNITFARARKSAELILRYTLAALEKHDPTLKVRVTAYRAGYTAEERRAIEQGLFNGRLIGVTATNALELGIDVGDLDATVLTGYPGTIASTWQQAGRAGRANAESLSVLVAFDNPLDQFLMRHPEYFFGRPHERCVVDPDNRRILARHLLCAAYERALSEADVDLFGPNARGVLAELESAGTLRFYAGRWRYAGEHYPARGVNIRSASDRTFRIVEGDRTIGTVEGSLACKRVHPGAIYLHLGESYFVERLDLDGASAYVRPIDANYYTEAREDSRLTVVETRATRAMGRTEAVFGDVVVTTQVLGYRRKRLYSDDVLETVDLALPEQTFETEAFWYVVPEPIAQELANCGHDLAGSIHAAEHACIGMMPLLSTCDRWDVGGLSSTDHPDIGKPAVFVYDAYPGGIGIAEAVYDDLDALLESTRELIAGCPCAEGCPSCVQSPKCGNNNEPLDKAGAARLLALLLEKHHGAPAHARRELGPRGERDASYASTAHAITGTDRGART